MTTQKISPAPGGGKTRPATGKGDPRVGMNRGEAGTGFPGTKTNGKVFANMSPGEVSGAGQNMEGPQGGPYLKGPTNSNKKIPVEDKSSRGEDMER